MHCSPPGSSVHGILQARILNWVAMPSSMASSQLRDRNWVSSVSCIGRQVHYHWHPLGSPQFFLYPEIIERDIHFYNPKWSEVAQSYPTLCDAMDCSLPGFSIHGILQARILEWVTISFSRGSSRPRDRTRVFCIGGFNLWATREAPKIL